MVGSKTNKSQSSEKPPDLISASTAGDVRPNKNIVKLNKFFCKKIYHKDLFLFSEIFTKNISETSLVKIQSARQDQTKKFFFAQFQALIQQYNNNKLYFYVHILNT